LLLEAASDRESQSGDSEESESGSDTATHIKVAAAAALAGITFDFGQSTMTRTRLASLGNNSHYFIEGYAQPPGVEYVLDPWPDEACSRISLLLGFVCPHTWFFWTFCVNFECNCIN
jgi:hypothetical protein